MHNSEKKKRRRESMLDICLETYCHKIEVRNV